jgi:hypothetical protein
VSDLIDAYEAIEKMKNNPPPSDGLSGPPIDSIPTLNLPSNVEVSSDKVCYKDITDEVLKRTGLSQSLSLPDNIYVLLGMYFILLLFAYFMLWRSLVGKKRVKYE